MRPRRRQMPQPRGTERGTGALRGMGSSFQQSGTGNAAIGGSSDPTGNPSGYDMMVRAGRGGYTKLDDGQLIKGTYLTANSAPYRTGSTPTPWVYNGQRIGTMGAEGWQSTLPQGRQGAMKQPFDNQGRQPMPQQQQPVRDYVGNTQRNSAVGMPTRLGNAMNGPNGGLLDVRSPHQANRINQWAAGGGMRGAPIAGAGSVQSRFFGAFPGMKNQYLSKLYPGVDVRDPLALRRAQWQARIQAMREQDQNSMMDLAGVM